MITLTLSVNPDGAVPLYKQLYNFLRDEIRAGSLKAGEKLPSKRSLSSYLKISLNTIETAYSQLAAEGYIKAVPKSGFYICDFEAFSFPSGPQKRAESIEPEQSPYRFDFRTNTVDTSFFPFSTWARISREIIHDENRDLLIKTHPQGDYPLRECIAEYLHEFRGVNCLPEQVIIGAGTEYLLWLIAQVLGGDSIYAVENPGYSKTYRILKGTNAKVNLIGLDEEGIKADELERSDSNVVYVTPSHHFPLGIVMPVSRRMQLLKWANKEDARYIIEDDYDSEFRFSGRPIPALQGLDTDGKVIYLSTFSKSIAPSMRISYMVLPPSLLEKYRSEFLFYSSTVSRFEQYTLYKFIREGHFERHLNRMRNIYRIRKDKIVEEIKKLPSSKRIEIIGENAGLHLLLKVSGMSEAELIGQAEAGGVRLYGLTDYYIEPQAAMPRSTVVLGYAHLKPEEIEEAVALIGAAWFDTL
jgi:GntR family transcriptional regulator/MocR family aminotransferase